MGPPIEQLIQRPLYVFDLPEEILHSLHLKAQSSLPQSEPEPETTASNGIERDQGATDAKAPATSCALCSLTFPTLLDQRSHVRSDLHAYNLKQKQRGRKAVDEAEFEKLVGQLDESISGSESSSSEEDEDDKTKESTLSALLKRQAKVTDGDAEDAPVKKRKRGGGGTPPMVWFGSSKLPENTSFGVYRAVFTPEEQDKEDQLVETIKSKQLAAKPPPNPQQKPKEDAEEDGGVPLPASMISPNTSASGPHYFLCMIGGGHFAGMIISLTPKLTKKAGIEDRAATVIAHKTFHRYTTRRKQGGSQSANDNSKGNAHSAGAGIRRYNEAALEHEVRALLAEWKPLIDSSDLLFIRATGSTNRRTLFGPYEDAFLSQKDSRLRGFPFSTRRATESELMRAFVELTRVKVSILDEAELARRAAIAAEAEKAAAAAAQSAATASSTPKPPKPSKADEEATLHTTQLQALIRRSKAPAVLSYLTTNSLSPDFLFFPQDQNHHAPTPLHLAASSNSPACVSALLTKASADPTITNAEGKTPFDIAGDRATRDAFRLARSTIGESKWLWETAHVPPALSQAEVDKRAEREKAEKADEAGAEKARRERERERLRKEDEAKVEAGREKKFGLGRSLVGKPPLTAEERRAEEGRGMTDEMRLKLERERRARAAEDRMRRLQAK